MASFQLARGPHLRLLLGVNEQILQILVDHLAQREQRQSYPAAVRLNPLNRLYLMTHHAGGCVLIAALENDFGQLGAW